MSLHRVLTWNVITGTPADISGTVLVPGLVSPSLFYRQMTDVKETVTYTQGLTLTEGSEIFTKTGVETSLEAAVQYGAFSASVSTTISHEINQVNTQESESTWSREVNPSTFSNVY